MKIERFEDLTAWQEARALVALIYGATATAPFSNDRELVRQMRRAAVSVMSNIAEGFSRYSYRDSKQFFMVSRSSLAELRSQSYVAADQGYANHEELVAMQESMERVGKLVTGLIRNSREQLARAEVNRMSDSAIEPLSYRTQS